MNKITLNDLYNMGDVLYGAIEQVRSEIPDVPSDYQELADEVTEIQDDLEDLKTVLDAHDALTSVSWELGTIGADGVDKAGSMRIRSATYIPIEQFYKYENKLNPATISFAYDSNKSFLGRMTSSLSSVYYTKDDILASYPTTKYVRIIFYAATVAEVADNTIVFGSDVYYKAYKAYFGLNDYLSPTGYAYFGERITFNQNRCSYSALPYNGEGQDAVQSGNYFFACRNNGVIVMKRKDTGANLKVLTPSGITPHCNSAVWGNKYTSDDVFPLIYANAYDATGYPNGRCYALRLSDLSATGVPQTISVVQTITVGFASGEPWTDENDIRPYGNFFVDAENGFLWAYTLRDADKVTRFFKFALPDLANSEVTLTTADILEQFDVPYMAYIQGNTFQDGKAYILSGMGTETYNGMLNVVDLSARSIVSIVNLNKIGLAIEPEFINIEDSNIILGKTTAYKFSF